jgi:hypothetical protein
LREGAWEPSQETQTVPGLGRRTSFARGADGASEGKHARESKRVHEIQEAPAPRALARRTQACAAASG